MNERRARHTGNCNVPLWTTTHVHTSVGQQAETYFHQLNVDTGCRREELFKVLTGWDGRRNREREKNR